MNLIPSIANYFGISIDELFSYANNRERMVREIIDKVDAFQIKLRGDDGWVDECIAILREGLAEFPGNERLLITLADALSEAGWRRHYEWVYYDEEGYMRHDYDVHRKNEYWVESIKICERLADTAMENDIRTKALSILVMLCRNLGENDRAVAYANRMPELKNCRELMLAGAVSGKREAEYIGSVLLKMADEFAEQLVYGLVNNVHHYETDMPIEKIRGAISVLGLICDDGNYGEYHGRLIQLYLYLSRVQWERGYKDEAFESLDEALVHAEALEALLDGKDHYFTAPLVAHVKCKQGLATGIVKKLPSDWPHWCNPDYSKVAEEMQADSRWDLWVERTQK